MSVTCCEPRLKILFVWFGTVLHCINHDSAACTLSFFDHVIQKVFLMTYDDSIMTYIFGYVSFYRPCYDSTAESETGIELNCLIEDEEKEGNL